MEQKDYTWELVLALLQEEGHIRALAKRIGTNPMMAARKMKELYEGSIVDYRQKGKNKVYVLKKTIEARMTIYMSENYKLVQTIRKYTRLRRIIDAILRNKNIKLAILFGSYAKGLAKEDSDIDIFIETKHPKVRNTLQMLDSTVHVKIGTYVHENLLIKEIIKNHVIIKGIERYYEKSKFFD